MSDTVYRKGDTVRAVIVGVIHDVHDERYIVFEAPAGGAAWVGMDIIESVEVLASPRKVGDVLHFDDWGQHDELPVGTVVLGKSNRMLAFRAHDGWAHENECNPGSKAIYNEYEIVYLPPDVR